MGTGQFCTSPSLVVLFASETTDRFLESVRERFDAAPATPLLSRAVARSLGASVTELRRAGAQVVTGGSAVEGPGFRHANTLLRVSGDAIPRRAARTADGGVRQRVARGRRARRAAKRSRCSAASKEISPGASTRDTRGADEALYARAGAAAPPTRRPSAQRQDADGRRSEPRDESRRSVSLHRTSGLHGRRHPRVAAAVRRAPVRTTTCARRGSPPCCATRTLAVVRGAWWTASGRAATCRRALVEPRGAGGRRN